ncbi:MAG: bifunctional helix-turn-helix transcriptional regulator/GNAT family N-acetyltransferase [Gemmatimonadota bacterium]
MSFFEQVGTMAIGSRLRRLSAVFTDEARRIYSLYDFDFDPRWFPVFYVLSHSEEGLSTTEIAQQIEHSHASVSQIVKAMCAAGWMSSERDARDARVNVIRLSEKSEALLPRLREQYEDVGQAVDEMLAEAHSDLWHALGEVEHLLEEKPLYSRVKEKYRARALPDIEIVDLRPGSGDAEAFKDLNMDWIRGYFVVEETDLYQLDHPEEVIIEAGGHILMALYKGEVVGTCALIHEHGQWELAKMAVGDRARGKGIGELLGRAVIERARECGASSVFLESNTILKPAIALYRKLGFKRVTGPPSPYERSNIRMELKLT